LEESFTHKALVKRPEGTNLFSGTLHDIGGECDIDFSFNDVFMSQNEMDLLVESFFK